MFTIPAEKEEVLIAYPEVQKEWIELAKDKFLNGELNEDKISFFYSYGFFLPKIEDIEKKIEFYEDMYEKTNKMLFNDRLDFELSKVRVNLTMLIGKNFVLSNRMPKDIIPELIRKVVTEVTKVKMLVEYEYHMDDNIKNSIPPIDNSIVSFEIVRDIVKDEKKSDLNIDELLDKISDEGIESLTPEEKEFLDKKSKDV